MSSLRPRTRRMITAAVLPLLVLGVGACSAAGGGGAAAPSDPSMPVDEIGAEIEEELAQRDDVATAEVSYKDDINNPASASVDVRMEPGADMEVLYEEAVRLVWQSRINPLILIYVNVINPADPPSGLSRTLDVRKAEVRDPIEEKYGPHPD